MHFDRVMAANDRKKDIKSTVNLLRAISDAQLQPSTDVDAEDEEHAMALKSERYIDGLNYRAIKSPGACKGQAVSALASCIPIEKKGRVKRGLIQAGAARTPLRRPAWVRKAPCPSHALATAAA
jgi:hypothetical protein